MEKPSPHDHALEHGGRCGISFISSVNSSIPSLPTETWIDILSRLELHEIWLNVRPTCLLFHAISTEIAHRHIRYRVTNLCSVHSGNVLSLTTPHFHWWRIKTLKNNRRPNFPKGTPTHLNYIAWTSLPRDQHPDIFLAPLDNIPTCFSLYLAAEMSWTYTIKVIFHRAEVASDGVEKWTADSEGGWEMYYGTVKGPMQYKVTPEEALKARRVCPTSLVAPLAGLVRMVLLGPDQGY